MANSPFNGSGLYKLRKGRKLEFPAGISTFASWCARGKRLECLGIVLDRPCLTIFPPKFLLWRQEVLEHQQEGLTLAHAGSSETRLLRALARGWPLTISEAGLIGIPRDTGMLGLLPTKIGSLIEVVAYREIIELWNPDRFLDEATATGKDMADLLSDLDIELPGAS